MEEKPEDKSFLGRAFQMARDGAQEIKDDVVRDAGELKEEFMKYGKNRLVAGGAVAFKCAVLGTFIGGPVGTKVAGAAGFVIGFFGGPVVVRKLEEGLQKLTSDDPKPKPSEDQPELPFDLPSSGKGPAP